MPPGRRPLSKAQKKALAAEDLARRERKALEAYLKEQDKPKRERRSIRTIATIYGIPASSLGHRLHGRRSQKEYGVEQQHLLEPEDTVLTQHLLTLSRRGFPLTPRMIEEKANAILKARLGEGFQGVGKRWVTRFLARHPQLQEYRSTGLERARADGFTEPAVRLFQRAWQEVYDEHHPEQSHTFGVDESGLMMGVSPSQVVVGERGKRNQHLRQSGNRQLVTTVVTICADGTRLKDTIIFKGKNCLSKWGDVNPGDYRFTSSAKGYITNELGVAYIEDFHEQTKDKSDKVRVLFVDGHSSHCTLAFLDFAAAHNIIIISYPPHCTHKLQGLDVACFGPLKTYWAQERDRWERESGGPLRKEDFLLVYHRAASRAFVQDNILSAFRATGIWPINHNIFTEADFAPAQESSTHGSFVFDVSTPVKLVLASFWTTPPSPPFSHPTDIPSSTSDTACADLSDPISDPPLTATAAPSCPPPPLPALNLTAPFTPSKRKAARKALLRTTRDIFTASTSPLKPNFSLPKPVLERISLNERPDFSILDEAPQEDQSMQGAKDEIQRLRKSLASCKTYIEGLEAINIGSQAQLVVQGLHNDGLVKKLYHKENQSTEPDVVLSKATDARIWSSDGQRELLRRKEEAKKVAEEEKSLAQASRRAESEKKRKYDEWRREDIDERKRLKLERDAAYEVECRRAKEQGLRAPPKPKRIPVPPTPPHLKYTKRTRKKKAPEPNAETELLDEEEDADKGSEDASESEGEE